MAWRICRNVITHALDYDYRVLPSSLVLPHAVVVEEHAWQVVQAILGHGLSPQQKTQLELPTDLGGCQMPMPTHVAPLARAADVMETGHKLRGKVEIWGYDTETARGLDGVDAAITEGIFNQLAERGVAFKDPGRARYTADRHIF